MDKIGIIAGKGALPVTIAKMAVAKGMTPHIICLDETSPEAFAPLPTASFALTQIESIIAQLTSLSIQDIVMVGKVERPQITDKSKIDETSARLLQEALPHGDDAALRAVLGVLQQAQIRVLPVTMLAPDHILPVSYDNGIGAAPSEDSLSFAKTAHASLSALDIGQSMVIEAMRVMAVEAAEGTDEMIARIGPYISGQAVFFKAAKLTQNKLLDPPVIGIETIENCVSAHIKTIILEAQHCLLANPLSEIEAFCAKHEVRLKAISFDDEG